MNIKPSGSTSLLLLRLDPEAGPEIARLELFDGDRSLSFVHVPLADLGLGGASSDRWPRDPAGGLAPTSAIDAIASVVASHVGPQRPLYLRFGRPSGGLAMLPWERWLSTAINAPIVRWPYLPVHSAPAGDPLEIAICSSVPRAKEEFELADLVQVLVRQLGEIGRRSRFHIFVDTDQEGELRSRLDAQAAQDAIHVIPAASAEPFGASGLSEGSDEEGPSTVESPWLRWLLAEAQPRLDLVLFLCHGYLANGRGSLAFAESPLKNRDSYWARFVGRRQLVSFLDVCGARSLVLCSPPANQSVAALLALADEVARHRPGPVVFQDFATDPGGDALAGALTTLLYPEGARQPFRQEPSIAVYATVEMLDPSALEPRTTAVSHPVARHVEIGANKLYTTQSVKKQGDQAGLAAMFEAASTVFDPRWKVAGQRVLERYTAKLADPGETQSDLERATQEGRAKALSFINELVQKDEE